MNQYGPGPNFGPRGPPPGMGPPPPGMGPHPDRPDFRGPPPQRFPYNDMPRGPPPPHMDMDRGLNGTEENKAPSYSDQNGRFGNRNQKRKILDVFNISISSTCLIHVCFI